MIRYSHISYISLIAALTCLPVIAMAHVDTDSISDQALVQEPDIVACTLEDGTQSECAQFTVKYLPDDLDIGPFCPATLDDEGGIWDWTGDEAGLYRIDRAYFEFLSNLGYTFYDEDGTVHIADIATAQPEDDHACINVSEDASVTMTMLIPTNPVVADKSTALGTVSKIGLALNGVPIFSDAPSIQQTGHMPALDTCGGHVDPGGWYHWHATSTDLNAVYDAVDVAASCYLEQDSAAMFGYAFDGFPLYGSQDAGGEVPTDLDECQGHVGVTEEYPDGVYHYHAGTEFPNLPPCLIGVQAEGNFTTTAEAGVGAQNAGDGGRNEPPRPGDNGGMPPEFEDAAAQLDVTSEAFFAAMEAAGGRDADLSQVATTLGVSLDDLQAAMPQRP